MKPLPFTYHRPTSRVEVDALLAQHGDEAKILAGGQSLVPLLNLRLVAPGHLIDVNDLASETTEPRSEEGWLTIGPLVRHAAVERSALIEQAAPLLAEAIRSIGHPAIRSRGTVIGSVAHADPAAELPAVLLLLDAEAVLSGPAGHRTVPAHDLFVGVFETCLAPDEWVVEIRIPVGAGPRTGALEEFARRHGDFALCGAAATVTSAENGARIDLAYFGVGGLPRRIELGTYPPDALAGDDLVSAVRDVALPTLEPRNDVHASARYRLWLAERLGARAIRRAAAIAIPSGGSA